MECIRQSRLSKQIGLSRQGLDKWKVVVYTFEIINRLLDWCVDGGEELPCYH